MQKLLMYNLEGIKAIDIKVICHKLKIRFEEVNKEDYGYTLGHILGIDSDNTVKTGADFNEEMLLLVGFSNSTFKAFLAESRRKNAVVALKAILTETNSKFTSYELYKEISAEHEAMKNGATAHQT